MKRLSSRRYILECAAVLIGVFFIGLVVSLITPYSPSSEQYMYTDPSPQNVTLYRATVTESRGNTLDARLNDGPRQGQIVAVKVQSSAGLQVPQQGSSIVVGLSGLSDAFQYYSYYRLPMLAVLIALFAGLVMLIGRRKGARSLIGLAASIVVIVGILLPMIMAGMNPFWTSLLAASIIAIVTILLSQGWNKRAVVALICIGSVLTVVALATVVTIKMLALSGFVDETSYYISLGNSSIDLAGLLAGGIIIATVGALDDIVTTQIATVAELRQENHSLDRRTVFVKASRVGAEHIASLVNTLALVYVGAALPLIVTNSSGILHVFPFINSEFIATEVVRIILVSTGLVIAVPVSTALAVAMLNITKKA